MTSDIRNLKLITQASDRLCNYIYGYLNNQNNQVLLHTNARSVSERRKEIIQSLEDWNAPINQKEVYIDNILTSADQRLLNDDDLKWIDPKNERLCYFVWCVLRMSNPYEESTLPGQPTYIYEALNLNSKPTNTAERYQAIINFFDCWDVEIHRKSNLNNMLKDKWAEILSKSDKFTWLNDDNCEWAMDYLRKANRLHQFVSPINSTETCGAVIASVDSWNAPIDTNLLFLMKLKKAWSQKKHRDSLNGRKHYNIAMSTEIKSQLDSLAKHHNKKINETIEWLISKEFKTIEN
ncbi:hypothetical protein [Shewanella sp. Isolate8]|uniref:hypothetical protein n=1 Tax=Shewanella sp. Isolate8 TaxID=2908529 RepID=UPI001EFCFA94|nr:hypothetical protein [Shewanella sp. Isolate8]MCG9748246.1 hypothetical protein [Shewanella sp. Isolate8]